MVFAILWKKSSNFRIEIISSDNGFIVLRIVFPNFDFILVNVYVRSDLGYEITLNNYLEILCELENVLDSLKNDNIFFFGDWNADPFTGRAWHILITL